jgi:hypothetical protein
VADESPTQQQSEGVKVVDDPLAPDAPIHHLLSIRHNPLVKDMTTEELTALVQKLRTHATSPQSLSAKLKSDSDNVTTRRPRNAAATKRKTLLENL